MFDIESDRQRCMLRLTLRGVWDMETLERFDRERRAALAREGWGSGDYVSLVDLRQHQVQPQDVSARGQTHSREASSHAPRKTAFIVSSMLKQMQVSRLVQRGTERFFTSEVEAIAWLEETEQNP